MVFCYTLNLIYFRYIALFAVFSDVVGLELDSLVIEYIAAKYLYLSIF